MYQNEIVHFIGGMVPYVGKLDQALHPNGPGWWRIIDPCTIAAIQNDIGGATINMGRIWGVDKMYRHYVDIYCPRESLMEIRTLDKEGRLYRQYQTELKRPSMNLIISPNDADVIALRGDIKGA